MRHFFQSQLLPDSSKIRQNPSLSDRLLGVLFEEADEFAAAESALAQALDRAHTFNDHAQESLALLSWGFLAFRMEEFACAEERLQAGLAIARRYGLKALEAQALNYSGILARSQGNLLLARTQYESSLMLMASKGQPREEAQAHNNLASVLIRLKEYEAAAQHLCQTEELLDKCRDAKILAQIAQNREVLEQSQRADGEN